MTDTNLTTIRQNDPPTAPSFLTAEAQALYIAPLLAVNCQTSLLGLHRKYPQAWERRHKINGLNARYFIHGPLEHQLYTKISYALFIHAQECDALAVELQSLMKRQFSPMLKLLQKQKQTPLTTRQIGQCVKAVSLEQAKAVGIWKFAPFGILDYFVEKENLSYENSESFLTLKESIQLLYEEVIAVSHSEKGLNHIVFSQDKKMKDILKNKGRRHLLAIESSLGMPLIAYLKKEFSSDGGQGRLQSQQDEECLFAGIFESFSHDLIALATHYPVQRQDIEQLVFYLTDEYRRWANTCETHPLYQSLAMDESSTLDESLIFDFEPDSLYLDYIERHLRQAFLLYLVAKSYTQDQAFFFKMYTASDKVILDKLQKETDALHDEKKALALELKSVKQTLAKQEADAKEQCQAQTKKLQQQLLDSERQVSQSQKQVHTLSDQLQKAQQKVEQQEEEVTYLKTLIPKTDGTYDLEELVERFNRPETLIVGGTPSFIHKLQAYLPDAKYYKVDTSVGEAFFNGVEVTYSVLRYMNHTMTAHVDKYLPGVPRFAIESTNLHAVLIEMATKEDKYFDSIQS